MGLRGRVTVFLEFKDRVRRRTNVLHEISLTTGLESLDKVTLVLILNEEYLDGAV